MICQLLSTRFSSQKCERRQRLERGALPECAWRFDREAKYCAVECVGSRWLRSGLRPERPGPVRLNPDALVARLKSRRDLFGSTGLMSTGGLTMIHSALVCLTLSTIGCGAPVRKGGVNPSVMVVRKRRFEFAATSILWDGAPSLFERQRTSGAGSNAKLQIMVGVRGFEPPTPSSRRRRASWRGCFVWAFSCVSSAPITVRSRETVRKLLGGFHRGQTCAKSRVRRRARAALASRGKNSRRLNMGIGRPEASAFEVEFAADGYDRPALLVTASMTPL